jgi:hypothetical protein
MIQGFQSLGHRVTSCVLKRGTRYDDEDLAAPLLEAGVNVRFLLPDPPGLKGRVLSRLSRWRESEGPFGSEIYPEVGYGPRLRELVGELRPDVLLLYTARAVAATTQLGPWPLKVASTVDLDHEARSQRRRFRALYEPVKGRAYPGDQFSRQKRAHVETLSTCDLVISHAAHHAVWLRSEGVDPCVYLPLPVADRATRGAEPNVFEPPRTPFRLLMVGSTRGIATLWGMHALLEDVLPALDAHPDLDYEIRIIGFFDDLPDVLGDKIRQHPKVAIRGYVEDLETELSEGDAVLVTTPIDLGFRTRIAEAFSFGACVIAHRANSEGMPELSDGTNILLYESPSDVATHCLRLRDEPHLRESLSIAARGTFEKHYEAASVCSKMVELTSSVLGSVGPGKRNDP